MDAVQIAEPAALIRIAKQYSPALSPAALYEATRGVWRVGPRKDGVRLAFAIAERVIVEVYEVGAWHAAGSSAYSTRPLAEVQVPGRWEFSGKVASPGVRAKYLGKSVAHYFPRGSANPVVYVNT
jgi:hypothetical protein